ncbi:sulfatase [Cellulophaga lytica]|uniref:Sulfatase n=1 Tax=Cellulophaga lytica (strain ATCC 23178 / DSM 7489 / JCM 8516 / NBRC 14961 / NCIMB 1423 / VKM B-1433 / Cy l20) TaxID=867900 RepID=F0R9F7_CELLC|nr:sulfatase [Cellulophaga lytica DSM 7489]AIM59348.1 acetylglucosamine-6-sulfatase [Cellulophaga lytica]TVZ09155.1 arylsulfatase A-like enzyme [Cellulophaga sp. RHA_52]
MFKKLFCFSLFMATIISCAEKEKITIETKKPNIIYIMADDHTSQAFGIYGSRLASLNPTPNLDKIANEGIIFDNCFVTNSICTPSRATMITGQYSQTNGVLDLEGHIPPERQYLPQEMKKLGYEAAVVGKWHLEDEPATFDYYAVLPGQGKYHDPEFIVQGEQEWPKNRIQTKGHSSDNITDLTIAWLKDKRNKDKPFFLMHHYKAPHDDFEYAPRYKDYLENTYIPEPASLYENGNNGSIATRGSNDSLLRVIGSSVSKRNIVRSMGMRLWSNKYMQISNPEFDASSISLDMTDKEYTHKTYQEYLKRYLRCVKGVDDNVAKLVKFLKEEGLYDNTIIVYTGDQGFMLGEHDYIDKRWMYEESMRMPFFVRYPEKIKAGTRTDAIINNADFAPTLIELAGGTAPEKMQGHSFKSILETGKEPKGWQQSTYYRYWMHMAHAHANPAHFGIRTKQYKLIFFYGKYWVDTKDPNATWNKKSWGNKFEMDTPAAWEFYDLTKDPKEMNNAYNDPAYKDIIKELKKQLKAKRKSLNEEDGSKFPHIQKVIDEHWND